MIRWLWDNLSTLLLALLLAVVVWVVAVNEENPTEERLFPEPIAVELRNMPPDLVLVNSPSLEAAVTVRAPRTIWDALLAEQIHVYGDLAGLSAGTLDVPLQWQLDQSTAWVTLVDPAVVRVSLEPRAGRDQPVQIEVVGEPAPGYEAEPLRLSASVVRLTGPASAVDRVSAVVGSVSLAGRKENLDQEVNLIPVDTAGRLVAGVSLSPATISISAPITQKAGYRDVAVKVVTLGQPATGYRITNITVSPLVVTLSSADPNQVNELPGFVETQPLDITDQSDDVVQRLALTLPEGVTPVGEQSVLVQVSIAAIEGSLTVPRPLQVRGLEPGLAATASPDTVDVLLLGPLPVLDGLQPEAVIIVLDLTDLAPGTHQITPRVALLPAQLRAENILPGTIEVVIVPAGTPTVTSSPTATETPTPTVTPRPTRRPPVPTATVPVTPGTGLTPTAAP